MEYPKRINNAARKELVGDDTKNTHENLVRAFDTPKNAVIKEAIKRVFPGMFPEIYRDMTISAI